VNIEIRHESPVPLEFYGLTPDRLVPLDEFEIAKLPVVFGNRKAELGEFAKVVKRDSNDTIRFDGHTDRVKGLGAGMKAGVVCIENGAGFHAGAQMTGGTLMIVGDARDWLGAEMRGGEIKVQGNAGHNVGSAYRGSRHGMRGGTIAVSGDVGDELGLLMRRGSIIVEGTTGAFAGASMIAGTIIAGRGFGPRAGAGMKRGTLISSARTEVASGFRYSCDCNLTYVDLLSRQLRAGLPRARTVRCYRGDVLTGGRGELLVLES
jgi:formylmethanofuran dehydrogenase subunit C